MIVCLCWQSVSCSLSVMGFGESIMRLMGEDNPWIARGVAIALVLLLLGNQQQDYFFKKNYERMVRRKVCS